MELFFSIFFWITYSSIFVFLFLAWVFKFWSPIRRNLRRRREVFFDWLIEKVKFKRKKGAD